jgi:hypothetical protein
MFLFVPQSSFVAMTIYLPYLLCSIARLFKLTSPSSTIVFSFEVHIVIFFAHCIHCHLHRYLI